MYEKVKVTIAVDNCNGCPFFSPTIYCVSGKDADYGECKKLQGKGEVKDLFEFCPFKEKHIKKKHSTGTMGQSVRYCQVCGTENNIFHRHCHNCGARLRRVNQTYNSTKDWKDYWKFDCNKCENYLQFFRKCCEYEDMEYDDWDTERKNPYKIGCKKFKVNTPMFSQCNKDMLHILIPSMIAIISFIGLMICIMFRG